MFWSHHSLRCRLCIGFYHYDVFRNEITSIVQTVIEVLQSKCLRYIGRYMHVHIFLCMLNLYWYCIVVFTIHNLSIGSNS